MKCNRSRPYHISCGILLERWHFHRHGFLENGVIRYRTNQNRHRKSWQNVPLKTVYSLTDVTIENVLNDNLYNDLGVIVNNKRMILKEAQAAWTMNILVRILLYLAQSYHEYFQRISQNYYKSRKVKMPRPELYIIFTGNKGRKPEKISLSKEFFEGADIDIEVREKVIYESDTEDISTSTLFSVKFLTSRQSSME